MPMSADDVIQWIPKSRSGSRLNKAALRYGYFASARRHQAMIPAVSLGSEARSLPALGGGAGSVALIAGAATGGWTAAGAGGAASGSADAGEAALAGG